MSDFWDMNQWLDLSPLLCLCFEVALFLYSGEEGKDLNQKLLQPQEEMQLELVVGGIKKILLALPPLSDGHYSAAESGPFTPCICF